MRNNTVYINMSQLIRNKEKKSINRREMFAFICYSVCYKCCCSVSVVDV